MTNKDNDTLVILTPGFPESEADTTCLPLQQNFVKHLKEMYPKLNVIVLSFQYPFYKRTYQWNGTTVISFAGKNKGGFARLLLRRPVNAALESIHKTHKIIGLLSFWYGECALIGHRFGMKHNIKHFCWLLGQDARKGNKYPSRVNAGADELIALSGSLQGEFEKNYGIRPKHLIPSGIDPKQFTTTVKEKDIDILGAGSLIALKQYDQFLEISAEIKKQMPAVKGRLVGDGPEKEDLQTLIAAYGLQDHVILTGEISHPEVLSLMQRAKLFLHTSSYEGFSGVCLEALAGGAQVISFCRPMKKEIENWHIVAGKQAMTEKALLLLQNSSISQPPTFPFLITDTVEAVVRLFN